MAFGFGQQGGIGQLLGPLIQQMQARRQMRGGLGQGQQLQGGPGQSGNLRAMLLQRMAQGQGQSRQPMQGAPGQGQQPQAQSFSNRLQGLIQRQPGMAQGQGQQPDMRSMLLRRMMQMGAKQGRGV